MSSIFGSGRCTGSIVNKQYILTASHCVAQFDRFTISAGTHDYSKDEPHQQIMLATESIPHPNFTNNMFEYHDDIALIKLEKELEFNDYVRPICLPKYSDMGKTFADETVTSTGWGLIQGSPNPISVPQLHYVNGLRVIKNDVCAQTYGSLINEDLICIDSSDHKGVCNGDSGGPMNYEIEDGKYMQIGVADFVGGKTCDDGKPEGFARVTSYLEWIEENTGRKIEA
uniref:Serine proteinase n=1 Tax=Lepeophtheirus salmonis TaxID=72036 RepID=A7TZ54_LEPSM|nr:serine proteinase [Lepeophtheirus salmonis]